MIVQRPDIAGLTDSPKNVMSGLTMDPHASQRMMTTFLSTLPSLVDGLCAGVSEASPTGVTIGDSESLLGAASKATEASREGRGAGLGGVPVPGDETSILPARCNAAVPGPVSPKSTRSCHA